MSDTLMVLLEIFGKACMFYNVRLFLYSKLHVEMCLINFGISYVCKIRVWFVKEFDDIIIRNPFCRRILLLMHQLQIEDAGAQKWEFFLRKDFTAFCLPYCLHNYFWQFLDFFSFLDCLFFGDFWYSFWLVFSTIVSSMFFETKKWQDLPLCTVWQCWASTNSWYLRVMFNIHRVLILCG